jgi:hypothetical protein
MTRNDPRTDIPSALVAPQAARPDPARRALAGSAFAAAAARFVKIPD